MPRFGFERSLVVAPATEKLLTQPWEPTADVPARSTRSETQG
jgi:hypothetical protein